MAAPSCTRTSYISNTSIMGFKPAQSMDVHSCTFIAFSYLGTVATMDRALFQIALPNFQFVHYF